MGFAKIALLVIIITRAIAANKEANYKIIFAHKLVFKDKS